MQRFTALATTAAAAAVALTGTVVPANAEAVVYENHTVQSNPPHRPGHEYASLDIPTGYEKDRLDWHTVGFFEKVEQGRAIIVDLHPKADTVKELRAVRAELIKDTGDSYREFAFKVNSNDSKVQARWTFTYAEPGTDEVAPFVSVLLMSGNQVRFVGKVSERDHVRFIRQHVRTSVVFPG